MNVNIITLHNAINVNSWTEKIDWDFAERISTWISNLYPTAIRVDRGGMIIRKPKPNHYSVWYYPSNDTDYFSITVEHTIDGLNEMLAFKYDGVEIEKI